MDDSERRKNRRAQRITYGNFSAPYRFFKRQWRKGVALADHWCEIIDIRSGLSWKVHMFVWPKKLIYSLPNYKIKPNFPSLEDEITKPRPDMNIKAAASTVGEKSINTHTICILAHKYAANKYS